MGFLLHWESLLSTHGDEQGMLEDFIVAVRDINHLTIKVCTIVHSSSHSTAPSLSLTLLLLPVDSGRDGTGLSSSQWVPLQSVCGGTCSEDTVQITASSSASWQRNQCLCCAVYSGNQ